MPGIETSLTAWLTGFVVAAVLYTATYLSFVRTLRFPRNWLRPNLLAVLLPVTVGGLLLAHVSVSDGQVDTTLAWVAAAFVGVLFYVIATPALAFQPASRATEFLARHGNHAGLWMLAPAVIAAIALPDARLYGLLAAAMTMELAWTVRRYRSELDRRLVPIPASDLAVMKVQAGGDLAGFAARHGIGELSISGDTATWRGCDRTTSPCPFNFYVNRLGMNTAPCCRERMQALAHAVSAWLEELDVTHWLEGGTLLGAVRENGALLPWEDDVDVSVLIADDRAWNALVADIVNCGTRDGYLVDAFEDRGFIAISHASPERGPRRWENYRLRGEVRLDLTMYRPAVSMGRPVLVRRPPKGNMPAIEGGGFGIARDLVLPTSTISLLGRDCACPAQPEAYLRVLYGDFSQVEYSYVDAGPAAARSHLDSTAASRAAA